MDDAACESNGISGTAPCVSGRRIAARVTRIESMNARTSETRRWEIVRDAVEAAGPL
jgi:hypothetical protein